MTSLTTALRDVGPIYSIPDDDLVGEVLIPAMSCADEVLIGSGYFSSHCLAQVAPGLAEFISRTDSPLRLMISPEISAEDRLAIQQGLATEQELVDRVWRDLVENGRLSESALVNHTRECFSYLIAVGRLEIRFVLMEGGMYHKKQWLIRQGQEWVAVHGSGNATTQGLLVNGEQMTVDRAWNDGEVADQRVKKLVDQWNKQWLNKAPKSRTLIASEGIRIAGPTSISTSRPTVDNFWDAWTQDFNAGLEPEMPKARATPQRQLLQIPANLEWRTGRYAHQEVAVEAFLEAHGRGVLAIATGGGKTRTALIACTMAQQEQALSMFVVILVPSRPLMLQWRDAVLEFGVIPLLPSTQKPNERFRQFQELEAALVSGDPRTEVMIATNSLFAGDGSIRQLLERLPSHVQVALVGDEMHHLGAPKAFSALPQRADIRMGLSATPIRQYDPDGTDKLFRYFGGPVFEFGLGDAIDAGCLTPYNYYLHEVSMTEIELDKWRELTEALRKAGFVSDDDGRSLVPSPRAERLLRQRRAVLEHSSAKIDVLRNLLVQMNPSNIRRCLIYNSAKHPVLGQVRQIELVNEMLSSLGIIGHQFTSWETAYSNSGDWLEAFEKGDYQVLTAMKVLDEGIDIPLTDTAFLLASSTVEREWVQRRGRILRSAPGKKIANLHDFMVVPPVPESSDGVSILKGELRRAQEFSRLSDNEWNDSGPRSVIARYESVIWGS